VTDDLAAAKKFAEETFLKEGKDAEKAMFDKIKEEVRCRSQNHTDAHAAA